MAATIEGNKEADAAYFVLKEGDGNMKMGLSRIPRQRGNCYVASVASHGVCTNPRKAVQ